MTTMKIYRDAEGKIINIGEWDYQLMTEEVLDADSGQPIFDRLPTGGFVKRTRQVFGNPLPEGATEGTADIVTGWDGGLYEATDPRRLPPGEEA